MTPLLLAAALILEPVEGGRLLLEVFKTGLMSGKKHQFVFPRYRGTLQYDAQAVEKSRVELTIEAGAIECKDTWLSDKDRKKVMELTLGPEMLGVNRHPQIHFVSSSITRHAEGRYRAQGRLTIRGIGKPVTLELTVQEQGGGLRLEGRAEIRLKDYNLKPPSALLGAVGTRNEMSFEFVLLAKDL